MRKRNVGERAETYFDSIDLQILEKLDTAQNINNQPNGFGILELANALNIKHKNLKPHIDKLIKLELIFAYKSNEDKLYLWTGRANMEYNFDYDFSMITDNLKKQEEMRKELEEEETLLKYLKKVRGLSYKDSLKKSIETDFRKLKSTLPKQINYTSELKRLKKNKKITDEVINEEIELHLFKLKGKNDLEVTKPTENRHKKAGNTNQNTTLSSENNQGESSK